MLRPEDSAPDRRRAPRKRKPSIDSRTSRVHPLRSLEVLDPRMLLTMYAVTNTSSFGPGSLSAAITNSNADYTGTPETITFNIAGTGSQTISASGLPAITAPVVIDGTTQPGYSGTPLIVIDGQNGIDGSLDFAAGSDGSAVDALAIENFGGTGGIGINLGGNDLVVSSYIGPDSTNVAGAYGIFVAGANDTIGGTTTTPGTGAGNLISGNTTGIDLSGGSSSLVEGNLIGTDSTGLTALANGTGIVIDSGALNNTIGGTSAGDRNVISGNSNAGVYISGSGTVGNGNVVEGNDIGVDVTGGGDGAALGNGQAGVLIDSASVGNTIGGTTAGAGNVISGNTGYYGGVAIVGTGTSDNVLEGNDVGTDATGTVAIANTTGVFIDETSGGNTIGGSVTGAGNLISGNNGEGIEVDYEGVSDVIQGNVIGLSTASTPTALPNGYNGIQIYTDTGIVIGGLTTLDRNVISGNSNDGVGIIDSTDTLVEGNLIGTDTTGSVAVGNGNDGVEINSGSTANTIGGTSTAARNVISGNSNDGVEIDGSSTSGNLVEGNFIGTDSTGLVAVSNSDGIELGGSGGGNTIGGLTSFPGFNAGNLIAGNQYGIVAEHEPGSNPDFILGNLVGQGIITGSNLSPANSFDGIYLFTDTGIVVGGISAGDGNIISGNNDVGLDLYDSSSILVEGNLIGTDSAGMDAVGNGNGVEINQGGSNNTIGGTVAAASNVISASANNGIWLTDLGTSHNLIEGNFIGVDITGGADGKTLANANDGIELSDGPTENTIGGTTAAARNVISGNSTYGVDLTGSGTSGNVVEGDYIGTDVTGTVALSDNFGVYLDQTSGGNTIGGATSSPGTGAGNLIAGNSNTGIYLNTETGDAILGNLVGSIVLPAGAGTSPADGNGISLLSSSAIQIGGPSALDENVISGCTFNAISFVLTSQSVIEGNLIGTNIAGTAADGSVYNILVEDGSTQNTIGGSTAAARNVISGSSSWGVALTGSGVTGNVVEGNYIGTDVTGTVSLPNANQGVYLNGTGGGNTIGGATSSPGTGAGNLIAGNHMGVWVVGGSGVDVIEGNVIGSVVLAGGGTSPTNAYGISGQGANRILIGGISPLDANVISGNGIGIDLTDSTTGSLVEGNLIGTNLAGTGSDANGVGIIIEGGSTDNTIGGTVAAALNVISGNASVGVEIQSTGTTGNVVEGDDIGLNVSGNGALANTSDGVYIGGGATGNTIGGSVSGARDIISGNGVHGIYLDSPSNFVEGDYIGTDVTGLLPVPNAQHGIFGDAADETIGGPSSAPGVAPGNVIAGNAGIGIFLTTTTGTQLIEGNIIGLGSDGSTVLGNDYGIYLVNAIGVTVGGTSAADRNVISGNTDYGVAIGGASSGLFVEGNDIGTDITGELARGNTLDGIDVTSTGVVIGGVTSTPGSGPGNLISGNGIAGSGGTGIITSANGTVIEGNILGLDATGLTAVGVQSDGVEIVGSSGDLVGGSAAGDGNVISGNTYGGVLLGAVGAGYPGASDDFVEGNLIGTNLGGTSAVANGIGVIIGGGASGNTIGGIPGQSGNVISGNSQFGVQITGTGVSANLVLGNLIGTDTTGAHALANLNGIQISAGASNNTIGGSSSLARNVISGNADSGLDLEGSNSNFIEGNYVGVTALGTSALGNGASGVLIESGSSFNFVGTNGDGINDATEGNVISGNGFNSQGYSGIAISGSGTNNNVVAGNFIGTNAAGSAAIPNAVDGVLIVSGAQGNRVGTNGDGVSDVLERNVISGNAQAGVGIWDLGTNNNVVAGNFIGTDATGTFAIGNGAFGVILTADTTLDAGPQSNRIGVNPSDADAVAERNIISGNAYSGVFITAVNTIDNVVAGDYVGTDKTGSIALPNGTVNSGDPTDPDAGIVVRSSSSNTIGGTTALAGNLVADNQGDGIVILEKSAVPTGTLIQNNTVIGNHGDGIDLQEANQTSILTNVIGTNTLGASGLGNLLDGIAIGSGSNNTIGATSAGAANVIENNAGFGVQVISGTGNPIRGNSIFNNGGLGIELGTSPLPLPNVLGGANTGPNLDENHPVLTLLNYVSASGTTIAGNVNTTANTTVFVDFYSDSVEDSSGYGQGQTYLGTVVVTTSISGNASFTFSSASLGAHAIVSTTLTTASGNTSEFSADLAEDNPPIVSFVAEATFQGAQSTTTFNEGATVYFDASKTVSPDGDALTYTWDFNDGSAPLTTTRPYVTHTYNVDGTYVPTLLVNDGHGGIESNIDILTIQKVAPSIALVNPPTSVPVGMNTPFVFAITDPTNDQEQVVIHWGDGSSQTLTGLPTGSSTFTVDHDYSTPLPSGTSSLTITAVVTDRSNPALTPPPAPLVPLTPTPTFDVGGGTGSTSAMLSVDQQSPAFSNVGLSQTTLLVGGTVTLSGLVVDPNPLVSHTLTITWGDSASASTSIVLPAGQLQFSTTHRYVTTPGNTLAGSYTIGLSVVNSNNFSGSASTAIEVVDVSPVVAIQGVATSSTSSDVSLAATVTEGGAGTQLSYQWLATSNGSTYATGNQKNFTFSAPAGGSFLVSLVVTDQDGATGQASTQILVGPSGPNNTIVFSSSGTGQDTITTNGSTSTAFTPTGSILYFARGATNYVDASALTTPIEIEGSVGGTNTLIGGSGNDTLIGGLGNDYLKGTTGPTVFKLLFSSQDPTLVASSNINTIDLSSTTQNVTLNLGTQTSQTVDTGGDVVLLKGTFQNVVAGSGNDVLYAATGVNSSIVGGSGNDLLYGLGSGNDSIVGGSGNGTIVGGSGNDIIYGLSTGNDSIVGGSGNNTIVGGSGNDIIYGLGTGNDSIMGGSGNATIISGGGNDIIYGLGTGNDSIVGGTGNATIVGGSGNDVIYGLSTGNDSIVGGSGNNTIVGGSGNDIIYGLGTGNDSIVGGSGNGTIVGGSGNDIIYGLSSGNDSIVGGSGNATIISAGGNDVIYGLGTGNDSIVGGSGNSTIVGGSGNDIIYGLGSGNDSIVGGSGNTTIVGAGGNSIIYGLTTGNDSIVGGSGNNTIVGGSGNDVIYGLTTGNDSIVGGSGNNTIIGGSGNDIVYGLGTGNDSIVGGSGNATIIGAGGNDIIYGLGSGNDSIVGGSGNATIVGGSGNDVIYGLTTGNDSIVGGSGNNTIVGGSGNDIIYGLGTGNDSIMGGSGNATIIGSGGNDVVYGLGSGNDSIVGGSGNATIVGGSGNDIIYGLTTGNDSIVGGSGNATIISAGGNDVIYGLGSGNDSIVGGTGNATIVGGSGNDVIYGLGSGNDSIVGGSGNATIVSAGGNDVVYGLGTGNDSIVGGAGNNTIVGGSGNDVIYGLGSGNDSIVGGTGNATIIGGSGNDIIYGGPSGLETIQGGSGNAIIHGGGGADLINGGPGNDLILGGTGANTISGGGGNDTIIGGANDWVVETLGVTNSSSVATVSVSNSSIGLTGYGSDLISGVSNVMVGLGQGSFILDARQDTLPLILVAGSGDDTILAGSGNDTVYAGSGIDSLVGGGGNDTYVFGPDAQGNVTINDRSTTNNTLDFSLFNAGINLDLQAVGPQVVSSGVLTLTLTNTTSIDQVYGSSYPDTILGNGRNDTLIGNGGADYLNARGGAALVEGYQTQVVYLDFLTGAVDYSAQSTRDAIQARIAAIYSDFNYEFTQTQPTSGPYETLYFNIPAGSYLGGEATELDWRNLSLGGSASVDISGFLGGADEPANTLTNVINMTATIGAHELGHLSGLVHGDSFGPIGAGIYVNLANNPYLDGYYPSYTGPTDADETRYHVMGSPGSVGTTLFDAATVTFFGEREAIAMAFADSGTTVNETAGDPNTSISTAQPIALTPLSVPNTLLVGQDVGKTFNVTAADVVGSITLGANGQSNSDYYAITATAGELLNFQLYSASLTRDASTAIDSEISIYESDGTTLVPYAGNAAGATNDDGFQDADAVILDLTMPYTGTYYIKISTYVVVDSLKIVHDSDIGNYELFMDSFAVSTPVSTPSGATPSISGDTLVGGSGQDTLIGSSAQDLIEYVPGDQVVGGSGMNTQDVLPTAVTITGPTTAPSNASVSLTGSFNVTNPNMAYSYDWEVLASNGQVIAGEKGTMTVTNLFAAKGGPFGESTFFSFTPDASGLYTVSLTITDAYGGTGQTTFAETVGTSTPLTAQIGTGAGSVAATLDSPITLVATPTGSVIPSTYAWSVVAPANASSIAPGSSSTFGFTPNVAGNYVVTLKETDNAGDVLVTTQTIVVAPINASVQITGIPSNLFVAEGYSFTLSSLLTNPLDVPGLTEQWTVMAGDGSRAPVTTTGSTVAYTPDNIGTYEVTLNLLNANGLLVSSASTQIISIGVAPTATLTGGPAGGTTTEGTLLSFSGSATSPSHATTAEGFYYTWTVTYGPNTYILPTTTFNNPAFSFTPAQAGAYVVSLEVDDYHGFTSVAATETIVVAAVAPAVTLTGLPLNNTTTAGATISLGSVVSNPSALLQRYGYSEAWMVQYQGANYGPFYGPSLNFTAGGVGSYTVTLTATDAEGISGSASQIIVANDVAPVVTAATSATASNPNQASLATFNLGSVSGPGLGGGVSTAVVDWGDGSTPSTFSINAPGDLGSLTHSYDLPGQFTVHVSVTDQYGETGTSSFSTTVVPVAPVVTILPTPASIDALTTITLGSSVNDPSTTETNLGFQYAWTILRNGVAYTLPSNPSTTLSNFVFSPQLSGTYTIGLSVTDHSKTVGQASAVNIVVNSVAPIASISGGMTNVPAGTAITLQGSETDPNTAAKASDLTYAWTVSGPKTSLTGSGATFTYTPSYIGTYTVSLVVTDTQDQLSSAVASVSETVVIGTPVITWNPPSSIIYGTLLSAAQLDATASVPGSFSYTPGIGSLLAAGSQTLFVTFTPTDTVDQKTVTADVTLNVAQATPTISAKDAGGPYNGTGYNASATVAGPAGAAPDHNTVTFSYTGTTVNNTAYGPSATAPSEAGTYSVLATVAAGGNYGQAVSSPTSFTISQLTQTIAITAPSSAVYGTTFFVNPTSSLGLAVTLTASGGGTVTPVSTGGFDVTMTSGTTAVVLKASQAGSNDVQAASVTLTVTAAKATPVVTWATASPITYGMLLSSAQLDATSAIAGTYAYSPGFGAMLTPGTNTLGVTFTPTDTTDYTSATASVTLLVNNATPSLTVADASGLYTGLPYNATPSLTLVTNGAADPSAIVETYTGAGYGPTTVAPTHVGSYSVTASIAAGGYYNAATSQAVGFTISKATPTLSVTSQTVTYNGQTHAASFSIVGVNGENLTSAVSLTYNGSSTLPVNVGTYQVKAYYPGSTDYASVTNTSAQLVITKASTTTSVTSSSPVAGPGQAVTFTAVVAPVSPGGGTPAGSVQFVLGGNVLATIAVTAGSGSSQASYTTSSLPVGTLSITAVYVNSDGNDLTSSSSVSQTVLGTGASVVGTTLYVFGANTSDFALITPVGGRTDGSTGVAISSTLNNVFNVSIFAKTLTSIVINGGGGNDNFQIASTITLPASITEGNGNNFIQTGSGNDVIVLGTGSNQVLGGGGNKTITDQDAAGTSGYINLGTGNDTITLGSGNDQVVLAGGSSTITAGNGNDFVTNGTGNTTVTLGNGNDNLSLGNGNETIALGSGNELLTLGSGNDTITTLGGNNYLSAGTGTISVSMGNGNNTILLGNGANTITLGNGTDCLTAGSGNNVVTAGNGNDTVSLGSGANTIILGNGNDYVVSGNGNNTVTVGNGNDTIQLGNGMNVVVEGTGNDYVSAGSGANLVVGGLGQHTIQLGNGNNILIDGSATVNKPTDNLRQILTDWNANYTGNGTVKSRITITYNAAHPNYLSSGSGRNWFFYTYSKTTSNKKSTDNWN